MTPRCPGWIHGLALLSALAFVGEGSACADDVIPESPWKRIGILFGREGGKSDGDNEEQSEASHLAKSSGAASEAGHANPNSDNSSFRLLVTPSEGPDPSPAEKNEYRPSSESDSEPTAGIMPASMFQIPVPQTLPPPSDPPVLPPPVSGAHELPPLEPVPLLLGPEDESDVSLPIMPEYQAIAEPQFGDILNSSSDFECRKCGKHGACRQCECGAWGRLFYFGAHERTCDFGIGHDRVMLAPFFIEVTQPFNHYRARVDDVAGLQFPSRAEYFWAAPPKGRTKPEQSVDYQDFRLQIETGNDQFSLATDLPIRLLDPVVNDNTGGFSDMTLTQKAIIVNGDYWQISQLFRTYFNTGSARKGLGTGHISLEPGVLGRYKWNEQTYLHGELLYWIPVGGADPVFAGERLQSGIGISTVLYETDMFAAIPTFELVGWYFFDGAKRYPDGTVANVDGEGFVNLHPGVRFVLGPRGDLGLFEVGVAGGLGIGDARLYDSLLRVDLRWSY